MSIRMTLGEYMHAEEQAEAREREIERIMEEIEDHSWVIGDQGRNERFMAHFMKAVHEGSPDDVSTIYHEWLRGEAEQELERRITRAKEDNSQYDPD